MEPQAYIFDVFGTLVDWRTSIARQLQAELDVKSCSLDGYEMADAWRAQYQPAMERIRSGNRGYVALDDLHRENLDIVLQQFVCENFFDPSERDRIAKFWERLDPWTDVVPGLNQLKQRALIAPCSNGSIGLMARLAKYADLPWHCILGAEIAQNYKPEPQVYYAACAALRLEPAQVMMVAAHNDDLEAARACGLQTAFIPRTTEYGPHQNRDFAATSDWDRVVSTLSELAQG